MALKKIKLPGKAKKPAQAEGRGVVQNWLPPQDVTGGMLIRGDGTPVAVIRVEPAPFALLSDREKDRRIAALREVIQMLAGQAQIYSLPRPIDLDAYIALLDAMQTEADGARRTLLRGYISYVRGLAMSAAAIEHRFYVFLPGEKKRKGAREELAQKAAELVAALLRAELQAYTCDDQEVLELLFIFFHPAQAAFERASMPPVAPLYFTTAKEKELDKHGVS